MLNKRISEKLEDLEYWYRNLFIFDVLYIIKNGIKNFWNYRRIIWNDRWYDYSFFLILIKFKLKLMIKNWDSAHYIGSNFTKGRMIVLLKRLENFEEELDNIAEQYYKKILTKEEYRKQKRKILQKVWYSFGKNLMRFWD